MALSDLPPPTDYGVLSPLIEHVVYMDEDPVKRPPPEGVLLAQSSSSWTVDGSYPFASDTSSSPFNLGQNMTGVYSYDGTKVQIQFFNANKGLIFNSFLTVPLKRLNGPDEAGVYEGKREFQALGQTFYIHLRKHELGVEISLLASSPESVGEFWGWQVSKRMI